MKRNRAACVFFFLSLISGVASARTNHTIESLARLSDPELFELVEKEGLMVPCVPDGQSKGKPGYIDNDAIRSSNGVRAAFKFIFGILGPIDTRAAAEALWRGKTFARSQGDCTHGTGVNKVGFMDLFTLKNRIMTTDEFIADDGRFSDRGEAGFVAALRRNRHHVNMVELNYSESRRDPLNAGKTFGLRDVMVPISGKNGVIYIGRAYSGDWITNTKFKSDGMVAWFFLDFSNTDATESPRERQGHSGDSNSGDNNNFFL